jgi:two-component system, OmpR family, copper resistance phosphate regulon response regulator CusR
MTAEMSKRILIVEDEKKTAAFLERGLVEDGFAVEIGRDGEDGLRMARGGGFDLIILDVMLPERDGWSILAELREAGDRTPVLFLTARDNVRDRVKGLKLGADDYLVKPFAFAELQARIESILRRTAGQPSETLHIGDLEIDLVHSRARRGDERLDLTPKEFALLTLLARNRGKPVTRELIAREVWDVGFATDSNVVDVHLRRLRAKLDDPHERKLLHTVRGIGYMLEDRSQESKIPG